jgi:hypothetical protein
MNRKILLALALGLPSCGSTPDSDPSGTGPLAHAAARQICAPWDGPGISIVLAADSLAAETPTPPYVEFRIFQSIDKLSGSTVTVTGTASDSGSVLACGADGHCDFTDGGLEFGVVNPPGDVTGQYHVLLGGRRLTGSFQARWIIRRELCG